MGSARSERISRAVVVGSSIDWPEATVRTADEVRGEVIEAYVVLRDSGDGGGGSPELAAELQQLVKTRYAAHTYPRSIHFIGSLPKTPSGKTQRYLLRKRRRTELAAREAQ